MEHLRKILFRAALIASVALPAVSLRAEPLRVGIHEKPPFAIRGKDGNWQGLGVDLWKAIAERTGLEYRFVDTPYESLVAGLEEGRLDAVIGELSITPDLEGKIDFSQPYVTTSLGAVVSPRRIHPDWLHVLQDVFSENLIKIVLAIMAGLIATAVIIWLLERKHPKGHFGGSTTEGIGSGLWFAATTMTSVGYGDKTPVTLLGRLAAFVWMLASVLILAGFIGSFASAMSEARMRAEVIGASDILKMHCGALMGGSVQSVLQDEGIRCAGFESVRDGVLAVSRGELDAFLSDHITLNYRLQHEDIPGVRLLDLSAYQFSVALAFPQGSDLRERTAVALLEVLASPEWSRQLRYWLGAEAALAYQTRALGQ